MELISVKENFSLSTFFSQMSSDWAKALSSETKKEYFKNLEKFLAQEFQEQEIFPRKENIFRAFALTPLSKVRVVIVGQDPYHGPGQAEGLSFSVPPGVKVPPSLKNIYKELAREAGFQNPAHGSLIKWAEQGVLLLNATLTVRSGAAGSHQKKGWEEFTDAVLDILNAQTQPLVFLLWGSYAIKKGEKINQKVHQVFTSVHPSPLSAHRGFLGCGHFSQANQFLKKQGQALIQWQI